MRVRYNGHGNGHDHGAANGQSKKKQRGNPKWEKGMAKHGGRVKGTPNRVTKLLKDAYIEAAELEGMNRNGKDGLVGFLRRMSRTDPAAFMSGLNRLIPHHIAMAAQMAVSNHSQTRFKDIDVSKLSLQELAVLYTEAAATPPKLIETDYEEEEVPE